MEICKQQSEIEMRHLPAVDGFKRYERYCGRGKSIAIDNTNTFLLKFFI